MASFLTSISLSTGLSSKSVLLTAICHHFAELNQFSWVFLPSLAWTKGKNYDNKNDLWQHNKLTEFCLSILESSTWALTAYKNAFDSYKHFKQAHLDFFCWNPFSETAQTTEVYISFSYFQTKLYNIALYEVSKFFAWKIRLLFLHQISGMQFEP